MIRALLISLLLAAPAYAVTIEAPLPNAAQELQAQDIFHQLKCVVCEGQALGESDAPLAIQMREQVRRMVADGKSEREVLDYFSARYGEKILLKPPFNAATFLLWLAPLWLVLLGATIIYRALRVKESS